MAHRLLFSRVTSVKMPLNVFSPLYNVNTALPPMNIRHNENSDWYLFTPNLGYVHNG